MERERGQQANVFSEGQVRTFEGGQLFEIVNVADKQRHRRPVHRIQPPKSNRKLGGLLGHGRRARPSLPPRPFLFLGFSFGSSCNQSRQITPSWQGRGFTRHYDAISKAATLLMSLLGDLKYFVKLYCARAFIISVLNRQMSYFRFFLSFSLSLFLTILGGSQATHRIGETTAHVRATRRCTPSLSFFDSVL
jgi:hypothetical protein